MAWAELFENQVGVAAAEAEAVDARAAGQAVHVGRPGIRRRADVEGRVFQVEVRIRGREVGLRRERLVLQRLAQGDDGGGTRRPAGVPQQSLEAPSRTRA